MYVFISNRQNTGNADKYVLFYDSALLISVCLCLYLTKSKRDIPLTDEILHIIRDQEKNNHILFGLSKDGLIFRSVEGNIMRDYSVDREIARICKKADIEYFSSHAFHNTYATRFMEQRPMDFKILSEILGHKDVSITLNLYTHVMTEKKVNAMKDVVIRIG